MGDFSENSRDFSSIGRVFCSSAWDSVDNESSRVLVASAFDYCSRSALLKFEGAITDGKAVWFTKAFEINRSDTSEAKTFSILQF